MRFLDFLQSLKTENDPTPARLRGIATLGANEGEPWYESTTRMKKYRKVRKAHQRMQRASRVANR